MAERQFFEFKLESDTTTESGSLPFINDLFVDIVNYDEVNPYFYNIGYKENLDHVPEEKSQRAKFGLTKMLPYKKITFYKRQNEADAKDPGKLEVDNTEYDVTDAVFLDGTRYIMAVYDNYSKMKIFKQINVVETISCANETYESGFDGHFVNVSKYTYKSGDDGEKTIYHYPFTRCCSTKFTVAGWGKGKIKQSGKKGFMQVKLLAESLFYYFYDTADEINAGAGDFLYVNEGGLSGQIVPLSGSATTGDYNGVETTFSWTGVNFNETSNEGVSQEHSWVIYESYGDIIHFACADGLLHLNYTNKVPAETETTICGSMYSNTNNLTTKPNFLISSMLLFSPLDSIALYDVSDGDVKYGLSGYLKFYFKASNQFYISKDFTDLVEYQDYLLMLGPGKTGLAYPYMSQHEPGIVRNFYRPIGNGYINRYAWIADGTSFLMMNQKGLWALELIASGYGDSSRFPIVANRTFQPGPFITDISQYNREMGDRIGLSLVDKQLQLFFSNDQGTIVWIKSIEHNYWRQHILDKSRLTEFKSGVYLGNGLYGRGGDDEVKTYISFIFGDKTFLTPKNLISLKLGLGRDSWITKGNTVLEITYTLGGRSYTVRYNDRHTSTWIKELMQLKRSDNESDEYVEYGNETVMKSGEGHGKLRDKRLYTPNRIRAFFDYDPTGSRTDTDYYDINTLANRTYVHADLGYMADIVSFRLITTGKDNIEFYGAQVWYEVTDESSGSLDNSIVELDSAEDGSSPYS